MLWNDFPCRGTDESLPLAKDPLGLIDGLGLPDLADLFDLFDPIESIAVSYTHLTLPTTSRV